MVGRILWNLASGVAARSISKPKPGLGVSYPCIWRSRARLSECDFNLHMNNASYLSAMDNARWHLVGSLGFVQYFASRKMTLLGGSQAIRYRHAIPPLAEYEIHSEFAHWDEKWVFVSQRFVCPRTGTVFAEGLIRGAARKGRHFVPMRDIYREVTGLDVDLSKTQPNIAGFVSWEAATKDRMEAEVVKEDLACRVIESNGMWAA